MSLTGALYVGASGLSVNQTALEVAGNNLSNSATDGYSRQKAVTSAGGGYEIAPGTFLGTGARLDAITRQVDEALNARVRTAVSDQNAAQSQQNILSQIESIENELSDQGLSSQLSTFLNNWSQLAANPTDNGVKSVVISQGQALASYLQNFRSDLTNLRSQVDSSLSSDVKTANGLLDNIASLNQQIALAEKGTGSANDLLDQRDRDLDQLSKYLNITTIDQPGGGVNVYLDSTPLVLNTQNRGLTLETGNVDGQLVSRLRVAADGTEVQPDSGTIGQLLTARTEDVNPAIDAVDGFASNLIYELNKVHSSGQGSTDFTTVRSTNLDSDPTAALNDAAATQLAFAPSNGSFQVHLTQKSTGASSATQINIDLTGTGTDTTLNDLASQLNAVPNLSATINADGSLTLATTNSDYTLSFSDDSSGVLAALGINTFFTGSDASNIAVNNTLSSDPTKLSVGKTGVAGSNDTALAIAALGDQPLDSLGGVSLKDQWTQHVEGLASKTAQANQKADATKTIADGLTNQKLSISGVSVDEESINLLQFQRAFQGSARFISVVDQMMQTLLGLVQ